MHPSEKHDPATNHNDLPRPEMSLEEYFGHDINEKEALKLHAADTPEGVSRALSEQFGGANSAVRPRPNNL